MGKKKRRLRVLTLILVSALLITLTTGVALGAGDENMAYVEEDVGEAVPVDVEGAMTEPGTGPPAAVPSGEEQALPAPEEESADETLEENGRGEEPHAVESGEDAAEEEQTELSEEAVETTGEPDLEAMEDIRPLGAYVVLEDGVSAIVTDFAQLKNAIEGDNGILNVYMGADIEILQNRTVIPASKPEFTLSGTDPRTGIKYTMTEYNTAGLANIVVASGNNVTQKVTMADMNIVNQGDYYGLIGIEDGCKGVELIARNVEFAGRQFAFNRYGTLTFEGANSVTILRNSNGTNGEELAEVLNVIVRGSLDVEFQSADRNVFNMETGASRFLVEGSLTVNAPNIYATRGIINSNMDDTAVDIELGPGAAMYITASTRLVNGLANNLTVGAGATFRFEKTGGLADASYPAIGLRKKLTVGTGATFYAGQSANGASHLIRFMGVPSGMGGGIMEFNNPKQAVLINEGSLAMVYGAKSEEFNVTTQYLDYWTRGQGLGDEPAYHFNKTQTEDGQDIRIEMIHTAGKPKSLSSNHKGITVDVLKLDATAKQIVFGQDPQATLKFSAKHEETGEAVAGFEMKDMVADIGVEIKIAPPEVPGYIVTGVAVDGGGMQELTDGYAFIVPEAETVSVVFYYAEPVLEISVPVKMMFAAYEEDGGAITSQEYSFTNHSRFDVDVSVAGVTQMEGTDSLELAAQEGEGRMWLALQPKDGETFEEVSLADAVEEEAYIGKLTGKYNPPGQIMNFTLGGMYYGSFEKEALWPGYNIAFLFEVSK